MNTTFHSYPTTRGLCAAFFLVASLRAIGHVITLLTAWQAHHTPAWGCLGGCLLWLAFGAAAAFMGRGLLHGAAYAVSHGLFLGVLSITFSIYAFAMPYYSLHHGAKMGTGAVVYFPF